MCSGFLTRRLTPHISIKKKKASYYLKCTHPTMCWATEWPLWRQKYIIETCKKISFLVSKLDLIESPCYKFWETKYIEMDMLLLYDQVTNIFKYPLLVNAYDQKKFSCIDWHRKPESPKKLKGISYLYHNKSERRALRRWEQDEEQKKLQLLVAMELHISKPWEDPVAHQYILVQATKTSKWTWSYLMILVRKICRNQHPWWILELYIIEHSLMQRSKRWVTEVHD